MRPGVTCVMVTGKDPAREPLARASINAFLNQTYPMGLLELLIVNDAGYSLVDKFKINCDKIHEVQVNSKRSLGELRNIGMEEALYSYIMQWDDDDYSHPDRISYQVDATDITLNEMSIFNWEIHCNLLTKEAFANKGQSRVGGFPGTMLFPKGAGKFPAKGKCEDTEFLLTARKKFPLRILDNTARMYLRFYHGNNTWDEKHVMHRKPGHCRLTQDERDYLDSVIQREYRWAISK